MILKLNTHLFNFLLFNILSIFCLNFINAQTINEDFINSLPESIRGNIISQIGSNISSGQIDQKRYSAFDSSVDIDPRNQIEILQDFSNLPIFGSDFFNSFSSTFMPINDPSADPSYILDIDDLITIQVITGDFISAEHRISRDGSIFLQNVGSVTLAGLSIQQANKLINSLLNKFFIDTEVIVTLKEVRDIQVLVTGEVKVPGIYTLGGYSSILHAISSAGGVKDSGTLRNVLVKRNGKIINKIDLYELFTKADTSNISSLRSGDSVLVNSTNNKVRIIGAVNRPAIYEFNSGETAKEIIEYSGGFSYRSESELFYVSRDNDQTSNLLLSSLDHEKIILESGDKIFVPFRKFERDNLDLGQNKTFITKPVKISGAIKNPGTYYLEENETILDLLNSAEGFKQNAYPFGGVLINQRSKELNKEFNERLYNEAIKSLATKVSSASRPFGGYNDLVGILQELKNQTPSGRVTAEFDIQKLKNNPEMNLRLSPGDEIYIPYYKNTVHVFGEVLNPGSIAFRNHATPMDFIKLSGGFTERADKSAIFVVLPNGEAYKFKNNFFQSNQKPIYPGSVIYIARDLNQVEGLDLAAILAPIVSSVAISLASINSISNN